MCAMMHWRSMFETVTTGISGHTAQAEPTAATIVKRFSALAQSGQTETAAICPLSGAKRTWSIAAAQPCSCARAIDGDGGVKTRGGKNEQDRARWSPVDPCGARYRWTRRARMLHAH